MTTRTYSDEEIAMYNEVVARRYCFAYHVQSVLYLAFWFAFGLFVVNMLGGSFAILLEYLHAHDSSYIAFLVENWKTALLAGNVSFVYTIFKGIHPIITVIILAVVYYCSGWIFERRKQLMLLLVVLAGIILFLYLR